MATGINESSINDAYDQYAACTAAYYDAQMEHYIAQCRHEDKKSHILSCGVEGKNAAERDAALHLALEEEAGVLREDYAAMRRAELAMKNAGSHVDMIRLIIRNRELG